MRMPGAPHVKIGKWLLGFALLFALIWSVSAELLLAQEAGNAPSPRAEAEPQNFVGWGQNFLPLIRETLPTPLPTPPPTAVPTNPAMVIWFDLPSRVRPGTIMTINVTAQNNGNGVANATDLIIPFDGRNFSLSSTSLNAGAGDFISRNNFPTDFTVRFGRINPGERRTGRIFVYTNPGLRTGDTVRVRGRFTNGQCGNLECPTNDVRVRVDTGGIAPPPDDFGLGSGPGTYIFTFNPGGFIPGERVTTWINYPDGTTQPLELAGNADRNGVVLFRFQPLGLPPGFYSIVGHGNTSGRNVVGRFEVTANLASVDAATDGFLRGWVLPGPAASDNAPQRAQPAPTGSGKLGGVVTAAGTNSQTRLPGVLVRLLDADENTVQSILTDRFGGYLFTNVPTGTFNVDFDPSGSYDATTQLYAPVRSPNAVVTGDATTEISIALERGAALNGTITASDGGTLSDVSVLVSDAADNLIGAAISDANGNYSIDGMERGDVTVRFEPAVDGTRASGYLTDTVALTLNALQERLDISLTRQSTSAQISGQVVDSNGNPLSDVFVMISVRSPGASDYSFATVARTAADGTYSSDVLDDIGADFSYRVTFNPQYARDLATRAFLPADYSGGPLTLAAGEELRNIDAILARGSRISGTVTAEDSGAGLENVFVAVYDLTRQAPGATPFVAYALTSADGSYTTSALPDGRYRVEFVTIYAFDNTTSAYVSSELNTALSVDENVTGVDIALERGGAISGTVTAEDTEVAIANVIVLAEDDRGTPSTDDDEIVAITLSENDGSYRLQGMADGNYKVRFLTGFFAETAVYFSKYYRNASRIADATEVTVVAEQTVAMIDGELKRGAQIRGTVTAADTGEPLEDVLVTVYNAAGQVVSFWFSAEDGSFASQALEAGSYRVGFDADGVAGDSGVCERVLQRQARARERRCDHDLQDAIAHRYQRRARARITT
ncbi:hypothetical protein HC891_23455 [Candidatus Gracilibacteria bacterium]|nr:hypothetical protein [Candidatus Gracilibacteria bacterium]